MCSDSDELSLLFNPLLEDFLLQGAFDTARGSTAWQNPTCLFLQGLFEHPSGVLLTQPRHAATWHVWQISRCCLSLRENVSSSVTTHTKEKHEETALPPHTAFVLHGNGIAEPYKASSLFLL